MLASILIALTPFILNGLTQITKVLTDASSVSWKRVHPRGLRRHRRDLRQRPDRQPDRRADRHGPDPGRARLGRRVPVGPRQLPPVFRGARTPSSDRLGVLVAAASRKSPVSGLFLVSAGLPRPAALTRRALPRTVLGHPCSAGERGEGSGSDRLGETRLRAPGRRCVSSKAAGEVPASKGTESCGRNQSSRSGSRFEAFYASKMSAAQLLLIRQGPIQRATRMSRNGTSAQDDTMANLNAASPSGENVRRQAFWDSWRRELRDGLAHLG